MGVVATFTTRPRGPRNLPIVGQMPAFRRDPLKFLSGLARDYGDVAYYKLGPSDVYFVNDPELIREVLVMQDRKFSKSRALQRARVLLGDGLLTSEGSLHMRQRRLIQPAFHRERLMAYSKIMVDYALKTRTRWVAGSTVDVASEMMRLTLAVVSQTLFSADVEGEATEIGEALTGVLEMFNMLLMPFSEYLEKLPLPFVRRFERARRVLDDIIYGMIHERRASGNPDRGDLLSMLLLAQDEDGGGGMPDELVRDEALTLFLAGHETTANALTWTWYLLSQNPECEARFHAEVDEVLQGRAPGYDDLPNLKYTEKVLAESMRLFPPVWGIGRMATETVRLSDVEIGPKSIVIVSPYVMHRNAKYYTEPERFDPERWTPEAKKARPQFSYFPFGGGSRLCIGERFAWMEGVLILATVAQKWKFRLDPDQKVEPQPIITLRTKYGMRMAVEAR
jgi:cytochrome P450